MEQVRMGIIGIGNMGSAHAVNIYEKKVPGMKLSAVCDVRECRRNWAAEHLPGVRVFDNAQDLIQSGQCDAVLIATPHYFHPPLAIEAFEAGLHVLTEKPAGVAVSDVQRMNEAAEKSGRIFGIMFNQRTHPLFQKARELMRSGALGIPKRLQWTVTNWYRTQEYYNSGDWRATWAGEGGGVLLNQAPHNLDLWQWIFGMPKRVRAACPVAKYHRIEVEDEAAIYAEYEGGATAVFLTSTGEYPGTNRLEIAGDRGKLVLEDGKLRFWELPIPEREFCFAPCADLPTPQYQEFFPDRPETAHNGILQNFADAILHGAELLAPGLDGIRELTLSNAAYLSAWTGEWADIPLDTERFDALLAERAKASKSGAVGTDIESDGKYKSRWNVNW